MPCMVLRLAHPSHVSTAPTDYRVQAPVSLQDKFFRPYSGSLVRLVLLCAAIHQAVFTMLSTIKFAVGQVQDVGLIFLSAIASR